MSLTVYAYKTDEATGKYTLFNLGPGAHLAGFEVARYDLWGSEVMVGLGLRILPSLRTGDIDVSGEGLDQLEQEVLTIRQNLALILPHVQQDEDTILQRTRNFLNAIEKAREVNGGVMIG